MDHRAPPGGQRPRPPQRALSGGYHGLTQPAPKRPTLPSRLSHIRSVSQPVNIVDLTADGSLGEKSNVAAFLGNREAVVTSPGVMNLDDDGEPPAKRAKTSGDNFKAEGDGADSEVDDRAHRITPGTPLPSLPGPKAAASRKVAERRHNSGIDPASRRAHGLDPPAIATRVPAPKRVADFSPWTGNHPEDVLSENVVKSGFFDKVQPNQAESNSAKAAISSSLSQKNNHGLSLLGYLFTAVLEKRQVLGKCTTPSAFKPPPRVTVTDTKREAWLRDLANPDVPLRKQSRTIPHGIRGKLLMEQCLGKDIPMQRAVWLAKCVGANELRAFRRKGVSGSAAATGESKWVREWTVHVEQFLEDVVALCGQEGWQQKMNYAVKLSTAFYSEKLLDLDHYLDWIVTSLADCSRESLPIWLVLAQVYWKDITAYGRRGRTLANALLEHLHLITQSNAPTHIPIKTRLQKLVAVLAATNRGCLVIPRTWEKYKYLLTPASANESTATPARNIAYRNERLAGPMSKTAANWRSPILDLYLILDSAGLDANVEDLAQKSLALIPVPLSLLHALLDWASTHYRTGMSRVYLIARIVAQLHNMEQPTDVIVLQYLTENKVRSASSINLIHRVVVELVRLEAFSVSRYLQWLITSGGISLGGDIFCASSLITAFATNHLPVRLRNTRNTMMRRLGHPVNQDSKIGAVIADVEKAISISATESARSIELPQSLTLASQFSISQQVAAKISVMAKEGGISVEAFVIARDVIERIQDEASLADLVKSATTSDNNSLLSTVADTINLHAESFAVLGEFHRLTDALREQYMHLRSQQPLDRSLILALTSLTQRIPGMVSFVKFLGNDLAICEQQSSLAVCSPASDSLIGMQAFSLDSDEDIDAVFASGNVMDEQLMHRVFNRVMQRALKDTSSGQISTSRVCGWLNQLRSVEGSCAFENLIQNHVRDLLNGVIDDAFSVHSVVYLVASGCLSLGAVADLAKEIKTPAIAADVLRLFVSADVADVGIDEVERYRYRLVQKITQVEHAEDLASIVRAACESPDFVAEDSDLVRFIIRCETNTPGASSRIFTDVEKSEVLRSNAGAIATVIVPGDHPRKETFDPTDIRTFVTLADPLSIRFCTNALECFKNSGSFSESDEKAVAESMMTAFSRASYVWAQLLEVAGAPVNRRLHEWAQDQLLQTAMGKSPVEEHNAREHAKRCLRLLSATGKYANATDDTTIVSAIADRLKELDKQLSEVTGFDSDSQEKFAKLVLQLQTALDLCVMHVHASSTEEESTKQGRHGLLAALCTLLVNWRVQSHYDLTEYLFDLSSALADNFPEAAQSLLQQHSTSKNSQDARLNSILGTNPNALDSWLVLGSQVPPPGTQQQRALNRHASQQYQPGGRVPHSQPGQQTLQPQHQRNASQGSQGLFRQDSRMPVEIKTTPFPLRRWEIMPEVMGENNTSLDLKLFGARKV